MAQINRPDQYFNTVLYSGDSTSSHAITGVGFEPDLVWLKARNVAEQHHLFDVVRGAANNLNSDDTSVESSSIPLSSFDSDGFTLGSANSAINGSSYNYTSWNFLAGGTASSNTDGSITSQVSANTTSGFSIVSYTGTGSAATVGHGLGATPVMGIFKNRTDAATNWRVWHQGITNTQILELNATSAAGVPGTADFNISNNTTDVWGLETNNQSNGSGDDMIAYIFAEKKGFSKIGSYTGNGSTDGTFVYTGFAPAFLMYKRTDSTNAWIMIDNTRASYNVRDKYLVAQTSAAELTYGFVDFYSNGFKPRDTDGGINASGGSYIYMAFAENPLVGTNNIPACAR